MNYLIDTYVLIWFLDDYELIPENILSEIENPENSVFISKVTLWEMAIKYSLGKLVTSKPFENINEYLILNNFDLLDIDFAHLNILLNMPFFHKDPFDRMIIAQAICEKLTVISHDKNFKNYSIDILW